MSRCIDIPVSWLRLERLALDELTAAEAAPVRAHIDRCPGCREALESIESDDHTVLPLRLPAAAPVPTPSRLRWLVGGFGIAAAAAALLLFVVLGGGERAGELPGRRVAIKGGGELVLSLVRDRDGAQEWDPPGFLAGDRFKVAVTCTAPAHVALDVVVFQSGAAARPLGAAPAIHCGNRSLVPGAFEISGAEPVTVCVAPDPEAPIARDRLAGAACIRLGALDPRR